jgi:hypothetical protein
VSDEITSSVCIYIRLKFITWFVSERLGFKSLQPQHYTDFS